MLCETAYVFWKKLANVLCAAVPETYFMDLVLGVLLPASNTRAKQKLSFWEAKAMETLWISNHPA